MACRWPSTATAPILSANLYDLDETGRLQYFFHSPSSDLPIRDVLNVQRQGYKTEPYLEKQAENYCSPCYQGRIKEFLRSREKFLFLVTRCMRAESEHYKQPYIIGWIEKRDCELRPGGFYAVRGIAKIYSFEDSYPLRDMHNFRHYRPKTTDKRTTDRILEHFEQKRNILNRCLRELRRLKADLPEAEKRRQSSRCK